MYHYPAGFSLNYGSDELLNPLTALEKLAFNVSKITLYSAGLPRFPANFTRDSILSAILLKDPVMLRDQLVFCALLQGTKKDPVTGEEPGKIFHENPAKRIHELSTNFNACDTTALFLIGHEEYLQMTGDEDFIRRQKKYLEKATEYILAHLVNNLFVENPKYCGAKRFALKLTYWKDSQVPDRIDGIPSYPAVFTLAHVQNMRALISASRLLYAQDLFNTASQMKRHLTILYNEKRGIFHSGVDQRGFFPGTSSDNLHMLYYLMPGDLSEPRIDHIVDKMQLLETPIGYMTLNRDEEWLKDDITKHEGYHSNSVWPFEQAFIHLAAVKFKLRKVIEISYRMRQKLIALKTFPELFIMKNAQAVAKGANVQLWTVAARVYFDSLG